MGYKRTWDRKQCVWGRTAGKKQKSTIMLDMARKNIEWLSQILISPSLNILNKAERNTWKSTLTNGQTTDGWENDKTGAVVQGWEMVEPGQKK